MSTELQAASPGDVVQVDCSVVMQIIRHVDSESERLTLAAGDPVQGFLTGLVSFVEKGVSRVEVTKCFPSPQVETIVDKDGELRVVKGGSDDVSETLQMFRDLNYDYECVGFYQAVPFGSCYDEDIVSLLVEHQKNIEHAIALIYDPIRTEQGKLSLRAFRLSSSALEICEKGDLSPKEMKAAGLTLKNMFDEFPVVIKNSHLHNVFLAQLEMDSVEKGKSYECGATAFKMASPALLGQRVRLLIKETEGQLQTADAMRKRRN